MCFKGKLVNIFLWVWESGRRKIELECDKVFDSVRNIRKKDEKIFLFKGQDNFRGWFLKLSWPLENNDYKYILAYKIKNISNDLKEMIANLSFIDDGTIHTIKINKETISTKQRLILTYSSKRAKKDKRTREKAVEKIEKTLNKKISQNQI